jgi:zinc transport system substrate-binding protein
MRLWWLAGLLIASINAHAQVTVLTSIKPLQLIAAAITDGVSAPEVLLPVGASHHQYTLKPSDAVKLKQADVIFWVGPTLETFLTKSLSSSDYVHKSVVLIDSKGLQLREYKEHHHDEDEHSEAKHTDENRLMTDPHIWLLPANAGVIAKVMAEKLSAIDSANKDRYQQNYDQFMTALNQADRQVANTLAPVKADGYIVLHDGYGYFEEHYGLNHQGELTLSPERAPGAKHLSEIEQLIKKGNVECVFGEPQFQPRYLDSLIEQLGVKRGTVDYLASDVIVDKTGYSHFLGNLANQFYGCLSASPSVK